MTETQLRLMYGRLYEAAREALRAYAHEDGTLFEAMVGLEQAAGALPLVEPASERPPYDELGKAPRPHNGVMSEPGSSF